MTILERCISLKMIKKILVVLGVVDMRPASVKILTVVETLNVYKSALL